MQKENRNEKKVFTPVEVLFSPLCPDGPADRWREIVYPGCISETVRCRMLILGRDIGWECRCPTSWCDLDLTFDLAIVALSLKILSGLNISETIRCRKLILGRNIGHGV